jgi:hypothetical protein
VKWWQALSFSDQLGIVSLLVTIIGFGLAIWQLVRSTNAAVATKEAIEATARRMSLNHLLVLLPQMRIIESDLDAAMYTDDRALAIRTLVNFSHTANQVASLLESEGEAVDLTLVALLKESALEAGKAKSALVTSERGTVRSVAKGAAERIQAVSGQAAGLVAQFQVKVSG